MAGHEQSLFVLSGTATLYLDGHGHHELAPDTAAYIASGESYSIENDGPDPLVALVVDAPTPADADTPALGARRVTVSFATQPDLEAGIGRTFRLLVDPDVGCSGFTQFMGEIPVGRAPDHSHTYDEVVYVVAGEGFLHMAGETRPIERRLLHLPAAAAHALPRERRRRTACACSASSSRPAARPRATPRSPEMATATGRDALPRAIRHRFPLLEHQVYLNSCSQGVLSDAVRGAYADYLRDWDEKGAPWEYWMERTESARASFAGLVGADDDEVAVTASVSAGVNAIASGLRAGGGRDRIVVSDFEFPTVGQIWHAQEERGYTIRHVPQGDAPVVPLEAFDAAIDERTALVAITQVCYRNGACIDVEGVVKLAHERGALVLLDSYQAIGTMPIDVKRARRRPARRRRAQVPARLRRPRLPLLPPRARSSSCARPPPAGSPTPTCSRWTSRTTRRPHDARRFQAGTPPIPSIYAGIAGIELMKEIGIAETRAHVAQLNETLIAGVDELGGTVVDAARPRLARRARRHPLDRRARARRRARRPTASSPPRATATCASRRTATTRTRTSRRCSRRSGATARCWPDARQPRQARAARRPARLRLPSCAIPTRRSSRSSPTWAGTSSSSTASTARSSRASARTSCARPSCST